MRKQVWAKPQGSHGQGSDAVQTCGFMENRKERHMRVGAIGSAGSVGAVSFYNYRPYIYNTNTMSGNSLSKVKPIGDDLLASKTDFSGMAEDEQNMNPLRKGETVNFADVIAMQMQMGRMNADRIMKPAERFALVESEPDNSRPVDEAGVRAARMLDAAGAAQPAADEEPVQPLQTGATRYQMQQAAFAYQMNMIA